MTIEQTLEQRGNVHGEFEENSAVCMSIMRALQASRGWEAMPSYQQVALFYIAGKMSRIVCGDSNFADHWHDITGYAKLVEGLLVVPETQQ